MDELGGAARVGVAAPVHVLGVSEKGRSQRVRYAPLHPLGVERRPPNVRRHLPQQRYVEGVRHFAVEGLCGLLTVRCIPDPIREHRRPKNERCRLLSDRSEPFADAIGDAVVHDRDGAPSVRLRNLCGDGHGERIRVGVDVRAGEAAHLVDSQPRLSLHERHVDGPLADGRPLFRAVPTALRLGHPLRLVGEQVVDDACPLLGRECPSAARFGLRHVHGQLKLHVAQRVVLDDLIGDEATQHVLRGDLRALFGRRGAVGRGDGRECVVERPGSHRVGDGEAPHLCREQPQHVDVALLRVRSQRAGELVALDCWDALALDVGRQLAVASPRACGRAAEQSLRGRFGSLPHVGRALRLDLGDVALDATIPEAHAPLHGEVPRLFAGHDFARGCGVLAGLDSRSRHGPSSRLTSFNTDRIARGEENWFKSLTGG